MEPIRILVEPNNLAIGKWFARIRRGNAGIFGADTQDTPAEAVAGAIKMFRRQRRDAAAWRRLMRDRDAAAPVEGNYRVGADLKADWDAPSLEVFRNGAWVHLATFDSLNCYTESRAIVAILNRK